MNVVIRVDASVEIGSGHVIRCLTLAKQLKRHSMNVTFICRDEEGNYIDFLKEQGMNVISFSINEAKNSKDNFIMDANETIKIIEMLDKVHLLIVDHYEFDENWEAMLRPYVNKIIVIDDLANRRHDCDLLLDQNYISNLDNRYNELVPSQCTTLLGPKYVLLREEFFNVPLRKRTGEIRRILVFFGGSDPTNATAKTLLALEGLEEPLLDVDVIVGKANPNRLEIKKMCERRTNFNYYCQVNNISDFMNQADLMIGAGGAVTWERCLLRLPAITISIADNQIETTRLLHEIGATMYIGKTEDVTPLLIKNAIKHLLNKKDKVKKMSKECEKIINIDEVKKYPVVKSILRLLGESK